MSKILFFLYHLVFILFYLYVTLLLFTRELFKKWIFFSVGLLIVYLSGSYLLFGKLPLPFSEAERFRSLPYFLFFFGSVAVVGFSLIKDYSLRQSAGMLMLFYFMLGGLILSSRGITGLDLRVPLEGSVESFILTLPYILFFVCSPIVVGFFIYRGMNFKEVVGAYIAYCFVLILIIVATTSYFGKSFGLFFDFAPHTRYWIEIASGLLVLIGVPAVIGYSLIQGYDFRRCIGALLIFLAIMGVIILMIHLTMGYEYLNNIVMNYIGRLACGPASLLLSEV